MNARPLFRKRVITAFVILIPIVGYQVWDYIELRRLIAEIEAIRAKKEPVTEREAGRGRFSDGDDQRPGRLYIAAAVLVAEQMSAAYQTMPGIEEWLSGAAPTPPAGAASRLGALVIDAGPALALADQAGTLAFQGFPPGTSYSYRTSELFGLSRVMAARTASSSLAGQGDAAVASALSTLKLQSALRDDRQALGLFVSVGRETPLILSLSSPSPESLQRLQAALAAEDAQADSIEMLLFERARRVEMIWRRLYGSNPEAPRAYSLPMRSVTETVLRPWISHRTVRVLGVWAELIEAARTPWPGRMDAAAAMETKYGGETIEEARAWFSNAAAFSPGFSSNMVSPVVAYDAFKRTVMPDSLVLNRTSRTAIAVERFRRANKGALPETLQALVPEYLTSVPEDPVTGQPLLFRKDNAAYTIYSVGPDKKDDGGDLNSELLKVIKQGYGRRTIRGADLGVRVVIHP